MAGANKTRVLQLSNRIPSRVVPLIVSPSSHFKSRRFYSASHCAVRVLPEEPNLFNNRLIDVGGQPSHYIEKNQSCKPYWQKIERWKAASHEDFLSYRWQVANTIDRKAKLANFLRSVLPIDIPPPSNPESPTAEIMTAENSISDVEMGLKSAPMAIRLTPHILSVVDWDNPIDDPTRRQFIPLKSSFVEDHPPLSLDSLHEVDDSPVPGLVHRYPEKVLFLATSVCPVYCRFCTRSYSVGSNTDTITKASMKPGRKRWEVMFEYIENNQAIQDVVISGGDSYYLQPEQLRLIGERLLNTPHVKRLRFATKGLAVCPSRILDRSDSWTQTLLNLSKQGRGFGKQVAMHTHFNHPNGITWVTELAARYLYQQGVLVRSQTVLLKGVNDDLHTMSTLIQRLANLNMQPYYVYQSDMVKGVEHLRTPLSTILALEKNIRGTIAGFMTPSFIVDLPGGGGKRLANSYESYDPVTGISTWKAPAVAGERIFEYHDPIAYTKTRSTRYQWGD